MVAAFLFLASIYQETNLIFTVSSISGDNLSVLRKHGLIIMSGPLGSISPFWVVSNIQHC